MHWSDDIEHF